ncbi:hypothetical protein [Streptomyces sp. NPDC048445]|uniref:hypothetical protein n=1 Tax=unclassified Streptomyces TaxID=2593676 RepID=UPI00371E8163
MNTSSRRSPALALVALTAAACSVLSATSASAATSVFPPAKTSFRIQATIDGAKQCVTRETRDPAILRYRPCDPANTAQLWERRTVDADGYGIVYGTDGSCINASGRLWQAVICRRVVRPAKLAWKQNPDGTVVNKDASEHWTHTGSGSVVGFSTASPGDSRGDKVDLLASA